MFVPEFLQFYPGVSCLVLHSGSDTIIVFCKARPGLLYDRVAAIVLERDDEHTFTGSTFGIFQDKSLQGVLLLPDEAAPPDEEPTHSDGVHIRLPTNGELQL